MTIRYPYNIDGGSSDYIKFDFYEYEAPYAGGPISAGLASSSSSTGYGRSAVAGVSKSKRESIVITMPNDIKSSVIGNWGEVNLTGLAAAAFGALGGIDDVTGKFANGKMQAALSMVGDATKVGFTGMGEDVLKYLSQKLTTAPGLGSNLGVNDALGLVSGYIINPNTELLYQGTKLRDHGYRFKLIAQSESEAVQIDQIVNTFKQAAAPKGNKTLGGTLVRNFIGIPDVCLVTFNKAGGGGENTYLPRYKLSAITNVSAEYITDNQYMTYTDGHPIGVNLTVSFKELKLLFSEEFGIDNRSYR